MTNAIAPKPRPPSIARRWIRSAFGLWAVISTVWLANSFRTSGVDQHLLRSSPTVSVADLATTLDLSPATSAGKTALIFICGSGVTAQAYVPLLHPIAEAGYAVYIVKLPYRFAPFQSHKQAAVERARSVMRSHPEVAHWVVSGHSLGGALTCRFVQTDPTAVSAMVLIGTTHPKEDDLSSLRLPVTKVYASSDGVAPRGRVLANQGLLPEHTKWVEIDGGNHSQFGHYGHQLLDGSPSVSREAQQEITRAALLEALAEAGRFRLPRPESHQPK